MIEQKRTESTETKKDHRDNKDNRQQRDQRESRDTSYSIENTTMQNQTETTDQRHNKQALNQKRIRK